MSLAYFAARLARAVQSLKGGGSSYPGLLALRIDPDLPNKLTLPADRIFVSGTNGKTSTTHYIAKLLEHQGGRVVHNREGANLIQGIISAVLRQSNRRLEVRADHLVMEIDELTMARVFPAIVPAELILTNLFSDQVDRYGDKWQLADKLSEMIPQSCKLIVNGDDPVLVALAQKIKPRETVYFGLRAGQATELFSPSEQGERCPCCGENLVYSERYYESLGKFSCNCGFHSPELTWSAEQIKLEDKQFTVRGQIFSLQFEQLYLVYNLMACIAFGAERELPLATIASVVAGFKSQSQGRSEMIQCSDREVWLNLVKNPAGLNQSLNYIGRQVGKQDQQAKGFQLLLAINNLPADGRDVTWLKQVDFRQINLPQLERVVCCGSQYEYLREVLLEQGILPDQVIVLENVTEASKLIRQSDSTIYALANFTILGEVRAAFVRA